MNKSPIFPTINQNELVEEIKTKLKSKPFVSKYSHFDLAPDPVEPAAYSLILGAGFSFGSVPLVKELMNQKIGDYYYPDQDMSSLERTVSDQIENSASFWAEYNLISLKKNLPPIILNSNGLPENPEAAYQNLFTYKGANILFELSTSNPKKHLDRKEEEKRGERFVKGFLRYLWEPGAEHGYGSTGRYELNPAHIYLALLLEAQQLGKGWNTCAFCRTIFTTNFDTLLQNALQMVNLLYCITDRPEQGLNSSDFSSEEGAIHLIYVHGSILRHNPASTKIELGGLAEKNVEVLRDYLESHDLIVIGYSGWEDGLMTALSRSDSTKHKIFWCDIKPKPESHIAEFLKKGAGNYVYVYLDHRKEARLNGADHLMQILYEALVPAGINRDPYLYNKEWINLIYNH